ncbi:hypothetical protein [Neisseria dentiae]|nr:hypothetical protein [Neisseria dentiae]QMT44978.1 hypothetical protein H3L92_11315 [Neisseria dentiae]STZ50723.1 Uncharacterised protein [Neisseria dentiae]
MNDKKHSLKKILAALLIILPLAGCSQAPKEVDGQPVRVVDTYLRQLLEINTDKEQQLYFRFKRQPDPKEDSYIISAVAVLPSVLPDSALPDDKKYWLLNDKLVKDKKMSFELELTYYGKDGKAQPVGLWQYPEIGTLLKGEPYTGKKRFEGVFRASRSHGLEEGYNGRMNGLAIFNPLEKGGYYHLSIRALQDYRNYPKMKLAVDIAPVVAK